MDIGTATQILRTNTMDQAKDKGCLCPVCKQFVKIYSRSISGITAAGLIYAYGLHGNWEYFHVSEIAKRFTLTSTGDFAKLRYWGLIEEKPHKQGDDGKRTSGMWMITDKGSGFVKGQIPVVKYAMLYNGDLQGFEGCSVFISQILGDKFDYNELMGRLV